MGTRRQYDAGNRPDKAIGWRSGRIPTAEQPTSGIAWPFRCEERGACNFIPIADRIGHRFSLVSTLSPRLASPPRPPPACDPPATCTRLPDDTPRRQRAATRCTPGSTHASWPRWEGAGGAAIGSLRQVFPLALPKEEAGEMLDRSGSLVGSQAPSLIGRRWSVAWTRALVLVHVTTRALVETLPVALYPTPPPPASSFPSFPRLSCSAQPVPTTPQTRHHDHQV